MRTHIVRRTTLALASALVALGAPHARAQRAGGEGYLFHAPSAQLSFRAGYATANAGSDLFDFTETELTLKKRDFSGFTLGGQIAVPVGTRWAGTFDIGYSRASKGSEFRDLVDNNNLPIEQTTTFERVPITINARYNMVESGRQIGRLAWIPSKVVPWVGAGGGLMWYRFQQEGDFVDYQTNNVFNAKLSSDKVTPMAQGMAGVDFTLTPGIALTVDARYLAAKADLTSDFSGYKPIDLSGVSMTLGLTFRM
jgi:opacity protein-like surface antigen